MYKRQGTMIGYHAASVIADAYLKGIRGYDAEKALDAMIRSSNINKKGSDYYVAQGFIPVSYTHLVVRVVELPDHGVGFHPHGPFDHRLYAELVAYRQRQPAKAPRLGLSLIHISSKSSSRLCPT